MTTTSSLSLQTVTPEFTANSFTAGAQMLPQVLHLTTGGYAVAYNNHDAADGYILLDIYDGSSNRTNSHVLATYDTLANTSANGMPSLTQLANGKLLVVWSNVDPANPGIKAALFNSSGSKIGTEVTLVGGAATTPHVEALSDGGFVLTYADQGDIRAAVFGAGVNNSGVIHTLEVGASLSSNPTSAVLADGHVAVAWSSNNGPTTTQLHARILDPHGGPVTGDLTLDTVGNNYSASIAALPNGNWAVAYADTGWADENGTTGISLKILKPDGSNALPFGPSTIHVNAPRPMADNQPSVTVLDNGFILVTWNTEVSSGSFDVYGRVFSQSGTLVTIDGSNDEFLISSAAGNDTAPDVATLFSGRFVTAWTSADNGGQEVAATVKELSRLTTGDNANDIITGDGLRDVVSSGSGNDVIDAGGGNDYIAGGVGDDTAVFSQALDQYMVVELSGSIVVFGPDGKDELNSVEHLRFADGTITPNDGSALFDTPYYLGRNPDVFHAGVNALDHFNAVGWHEGRDPNAWFDTSGYLAINKDVAAAGINPLDHYHQTGWHQGRDPSMDFDTTLYLLRNPDVAAAGIDPLEHFLTHGLNEGREGYEAIGQGIVNGFDAEYYLWHNPDVAAAGIDPLFHYNVVGWHEGRDPNAYFHTVEYLGQYTDVAAAGVNPLDHYMMVGWQEGRDASPEFDTLGYLTANPDVAAAGMNPLHHFLQFGIYEGRQAIFAGDW